MTNTETRLRVDSNKGECKSKMKWADTVFEQIEFVSGSKETQKKVPFLGEQPGTIAKSKVAQG